jgi:hypothetical protein
MSSALRAAAGERDLPQSMNGREGAPAPVGRGELLHRRESRRQRGEADDGGGAGSTGTPAEEPRAERRRRGGRRLVGPQW